VSTDLPASGQPVTSARQLEEAMVPASPVRGRLGIEWEQLPVDPRSRLVPFHGPAGVEAALEGVGSPHRRILEEGHLTAVRLQGGGLLGLEPGGQVEIATPASPSLGPLYRFLARTLKEADGRARALGFRLVPWGHAPHNGPEDFPDVPKARYAILRDHLKKAGSRGRRMMKLTASVQISLDFVDEADMRRMVGALLPILPYVVAYTANAPVNRGRRSRWATQRPWIWRGTDSARCGLPRFLFAPGLSYRHWVRYGLSREVLFLVRDGRYVRGDGRTFAEWLRAPGAAGPLTLDDWRVHVSTLFPDVRARHYLEIRTLDSLPLTGVMAVAALMKGLLCDPDAPASWGLRLPGRTPEAVREAVLHAAAQGPRWAAAEGPSAHVVMARLLGAAERGLRGFGEPLEWLAPLRDLVERDACPADLWRRDGRGDWRGPEDPDPVF
jgi:glutamate--cysteine ligase